jgi:hypothetical protein
VTHVRFGSFVDLAAALPNVCFTAESRRSRLSGQPAKGCEIPNLLPAGGRRSIGGGRLNLRARAHRSFRRCGQKKSRNVLPESRLTGTGANSRTDSEANLVLRGGEQATVVLGVLQVALLGPFDS